MQQAQPQWIICLINERYISGESSSCRNHRLISQVLCALNHQILNNI